MRVSSLAAVLNTRVG